MDGHGYSPTMSRVAGGAAVETPAEKSFPWQPKTLFHSCVSSLAESLVKQVSQRVKGTEKFSGTMGHPVKQSFNSVRP